MHKVGKAVEAKQEKTAHTRDHEKKAIEKGGKGRPEAMVEVKDAEGDKVLKERASTDEIPKHTSKNKKKKLTSETGRQEDIIEIRRTDLEDSEKGAEASINILTKVTTFKGQIEQKENEVSETNILVLNAKG